MIIDDVAAQANSLLIHHPDAITDFIIKDRIAVEVKATKRVSPRDLKGLKALMEEGLMEKYILVCREDYPQLLDNGILILPYKDFLSDLWGGKIL